MEERLGAVTKVTIEKIDKKVGDNPGIVPGKIFRTIPGEITGGSSIGVLEHYGSNFEANSGEISLKNSWKVTG